MEMSGAPRYTFQLFVILQLGLGYLKAVFDSLGTDWLRKLSLTLMTTTYSGCLKVKKCDIL
jgi:hypothetical protein